MSGGIPTRFDRFAWPVPSHSKEKPFLKDIPCVKSRSCLRARPLARNRKKQIVRCENRVNEIQLPPLETSESIEPNDNDLELNAIADTFSKIF